MDDLTRCLYDFVCEKRMGSIYQDSEYEEMSRSVELQLKKVQQTMGTEQQIELQLLLENLSAQSSIENEHLFQASLKLARELNALGVPLYLLSNTSARFYRFREKIEIWPLLKGALLSFEEKLLKPDPELYRRLFPRFGLAPGECFFIDDLHLNVEAARWCGMQAFCYQNDISRLRAALREAGIPAALEC